MAMAMMEDGAGPEEGARGETTAEEAARQEQERQAAKLNGSG